MWIGSKRIVLLSASALGPPLASDLARIYEALCIPVAIKRTSRDNQLETAF